MRRVSAPRASFVGRRVLVLAATADARGRKADDLRGHSVKVAHVHLIVTRRRDDGDARVAGRGSKIREPLSVRFGVLPSVLRRHGDPYHHRLSERAQQL